MERAYLPYRSAREHKDRGMAKWMGFFLSEHTTSLKDERKRVDQTSMLTMEEKWMLLSQLYVGKLQASITVPYRMMRQTLIGEVSELYESEISLKTEEGYRRIPVEEILQIQLVEGAE
jgi:hypothetical protein